MDKTKIPAGTELKLYPCKTHGFHSNRLCNAGVGTDTESVQGLLAALEKHSASEALFLEGLVDHKVDDVVVSKSKQLSLDKTLQNHRELLLVLGLRDTFEVWQEAGANAIEVVFKLPVTEFS